MIQVQATAQTEINTKFLKPLKILHLAVNSLTLNKVSGFIEPQQTTTLNKVSGFI